MVLALAACGGSDDASKAADKVAADAGAATESVVAEAVEAAEPVVEAASAASDSDYVKACMSYEGTRAECSCADDVYKAELNDELYELTLVSLQGDEAKAGELMIAYASGAGAATMADDMARAAEAVVAKCEG